MTAPRSIRVYEYGCGAGEIEGLDVAIEQMRRRIEFWNRLVEIDRDVRARMDALLFAGAQETELTSLRTELHELLQRGSGSSTDGNAGKDNRKTVQISELRAAVRAKLQGVKRSRKENADLHRPELRELDAERKARIAAVQAKAGLYCANRDEIRRRYDFAREQAMRRGRQLLPKQLDEAGRVRVQFSRGLPVAGAFLKNGRLQIDRVPDAAWKSPSRSERRRLARTHLRIRVAANEDRSPVWLNVPIILHRPLPESGVIRDVAFARERVGLTWRHRILITVAEVLDHYPESDKAVGVEVGWRLTTDGLRVASWVGQDGRGGELLLPISDVAEFKKIGALQRTIAQAHRDALSLFTNFLDTHALPSNLGEAADAAIRSSSPTTLAHLFEEWRTSRFSGDRGIFSKMRAWHRQYVHLWSWQANLRDQMILRRRELYRRFSADLSGRYGRIFVDDIQLARFAVKPTTTGDFIPVQRYYRFIAAISVLYRVLRSACEKRGAKFQLLRCPAAMQSCGFCGALDDWGPSAELTHKCSKCGKSWDQDLNAATNVLNRGIALDTE